MEGQMGDPAFWDNNERAQKHIGKLNGLKKTIGGLVAFNKKLDDAAVMVELVEVAEPAEREAYAKELNDSVNTMVEELDKLEIASFLTGQFDKNNAIFSIQAGAGGTESNDWADILFRMYSRWTERKGYTVELMDVQPGDQAGISKATILIKGENAYGYAKAERGVHRLVRISPFDSNKRRHTSFCAVDVVAEITEEINIDIPDSDVRIDVYRSSGKGGQGVNTTDSAVRITHLPTGIVVTCQNERSQLQNKARALPVLAARLQALAEEQAHTDASADRASQIRTVDRSERISTYNFPENRIADHRINFKAHNLDQVLEGDLDALFDALAAADKQARLQQA